MPMLLLRAFAGRCDLARLPTSRVLALAASTALLISLGACGTDPNVPTTITLNNTSPSFSSLGETQQLIVTDQSGDPLPQAEVSWSSSNAAVASVSSTGVVTAHSNGSAQVTATAGSATATVEVTVVQTPAQIVKISGDGQTGTPGQALPAPLVVQVNDALGNPVSGAAVVFSAARSVGSVTPTTGATTSDGSASTTFRLGTAFGLPQEAIVSIPATTISVSFSATATASTSSFSVTLRFLGTATPSQQQAFAAARLRWESHITGDLQDGFLQISADEAALCHPDLPAVGEQVDDVLIFVLLESIDGPDGILGSAGPCFVRDSDGLTVHGLMRFDTNDLDALEAEGLLEDVILHEMGHVLGFGIYWTALLADPVFGAAPPGTDPHFTGAQARAAFDAIGGSAYTGGKVPVENIRSQGADAHWREAVFNDELMTGLIDGGQNPLSTATIASLGDLGYIVNVSGADSYTLMPSFLGFGRGRGRLLENDILLGPIQKVDATGRVTGVLHR